MIEYYDPI